MVEIRRKVDVCIIRDRWTLKKSEKAKIKRNESNLTQREHSIGMHAEDARHERPEDLKF